MKHFIKKTIILTSLLITMLISICSADPVDWKDSSYNFKGMNTIAVYPLDFNQVNVNSNIHRMNWEDKYMKESSKHNMQAIPVSEANSNSINKISNLYIIAEVSTFNHRWQHHEAYTTWEQQRRENVWYDWGGHRHVDYYYETIPVHHPAYDVEFYDINVHYAVYDSLTNKKVFEREDYRSRDTDDPTGMFGRSFDNIFNTLRKLTKN